MSILIKGMNKKDFEEIIMLARYGANNCMIGEYAEVVEIPPHGRLIDADALAAQCDDPYWCVWLSDIEDSPVIIEAEEGE